MRSSSVRFHRNDKTFSTTKITKGTNTRGSCKTPKHVIPAKAEIHGKNYLRINVNGFRLKTCRNDGVFKCLTRFVYFRAFRDFRGQVFLPAAEIMHCFDKSRRMFRWDLGMDPVPEVEDMSGAFAKAVEDTGNLLANTLGA